jgi:nicotinamide mononucleotide transporter
MNILHLFDINTTLFTFMEYPMSYIEFFGTLFTIACVWYTAKAKVISWPLGIIGTILYIFLFYQIRLYSDVLEQCYFLATGFLGWWAWLHPKTKLDANKNEELKITRNTLNQNGIVLLVIILGTTLLTYIVSNLNIWMPQYFPEPAASPLLDAGTTVMSFVAQWLLIRKKLESWILWIVVDAIAIGLYWVKGVKFVSIEYVLFFFIASYGFVGWLKEYRSMENYEQN